MVQIAFLLHPVLDQVTVTELILATASCLPSARPLLPPSALLYQHILPSVEQDPDAHNSMCNLLRTPNVPMFHNTWFCTCVGRKTVVGKMHKLNVGAPSRRRPRIRRPHRAGASRSARPSLAPVQPAENVEQEV